MRNINIAAGIIDRVEYLINAFWLAAPDGKHRERLAAAREHLAAALTSLREVR